jgi:hypothetical protein
MPRRTLGVVVVVLGLAVLALSLLADRIGLGGMPTVFGWKQILGAGVGLVLVVVGGVMLARRGAPQG